MRRTMVAAIAAALVVVGARVGFSEDVGIPFISVRQGITPYRLGGARVFVVRAGSVVTAFNAKSGRAGAPVQWCPRERVWFAPTTEDLFSESGKWIFGSVNHDMLTFPTQLDEKGMLHIDTKKSNVNPRSNGRAELSKDVYEFFQRYLNYDPSVPTSTYPVFCPDPLT